jgi:uncharacterized protein YegP (UPF0339 family)
MTATANEVEELFLGGYGDHQVVERVGLGSSGGFVHDTALALVQGTRRAYAHGFGGERNIYEFYEDESGKHRWRCSDRNGAILFVSSQGYVRLEDAQKCARRAGWPG